MEKYGSFDAQAKALVAQMTLEERAAMLRFDAPAIPRLGVPSYNWWNEALHGVARAGTATVFPQAIAMAAAFDRDLITCMGRVIATEGRAKYNEQAAQDDRAIYKGLTFWSPNVNIFRDPRWGRGHETYGEDPYLSGELGAAFVKALQEKDEKGYMKAAACAKHFAVHSGPEAQRHEFDSVVNDKDFWETYIPAFEKLVTEAGVEGVMGAYNRLNGVPCCGSKLLLKDILREKWGFDGYVTSDCGAIQDFHEHHKVTDNQHESVAMALNAGCDLNCGGMYAYVMAAYELDMISEEVITECAERVMRTRIRLGLFDPECSFNKIPYETVCCPEHIAQAVRAAQESMVLLKNDGILPLKCVKTLGVIGPNADNKVVLTGNYHGTPDRGITPLEGLCAEADHQGFRVYYAEGCHMVQDHVEMLAAANDRISEAVTVAKHSDVVVLVLGLDERYEGEDGEFSTGGDKFNLLLPEPQRLLMEKVCAVGKPVILVNMTGSPMDLRYADEHCAAVLQAWYPGARGGHVLADVLFGRVSPSGKLPVTFYASDEDLPGFLDYSMENRTYRYFTGTPLYPFGFGLGYADIRLTGAALEDGVVVATVKNCSDFAASEVVQVYVKANADAFAPANPSLCGFERVALEPGEEKEVRIELSRYAFTVVTDAGERVPAKGGCTLYCGFNQPDARSEALTGKKCIALSI